MSDVQHVQVLSEVVGLLMREKDFLIPQRKDLLEFTRWVADECSDPEAVRRAKEVLANFEITVRPS